jgi:hypothetical protein
MARDSNREARDSNRGELVCLGSSFATGHVDLARSEATSSPDRVSFVSARARYWGPGVPVRAWSGGPTEALCAFGSPTKTFQTATRIESASWAKSPRRSG